MSCRAAGRGCGLRRRERARGRRRQGEHSLRMHANRQVVFRGSPMSIDRRYSYRK